MPAKKMFALFQPGKRDTTQPTTKNRSGTSASSTATTSIAQPQSATPNGNLDANEGPSSSSSSSSSSSKRSSRHRAVKDKPVNYFFPQIDLTGDEEHMTSDPNLAEASTSTASAAQPAKAAKRQRRSPPPSAIHTPPPPPPPAPAPLPPLSLNVKGTGIQSDQPAHSFFAKRVQQTKPERDKHSADSSATKGLSSSRKRAKIPTSEPAFPTRESQHVRHEQTSLQSEHINAVLQSSLPFDHRRRDKGKGKQRQSSSTNTEDGDGFIPASATGRVKRLRETPKRPRTLPYLRSPTHLTWKVDGRPPTSAHSEHPAFRAIHEQVQTSRSNTDPSVSTSLWTQQYRPRKSEQVLTNTEQARYLASWLRVLHLTSKRSRHEAQDSHNTDASTSSSHGPPPTRKKFRRGKGTDDDDDAVNDAEDAELISFFKQFNPRGATSSQEESGNDTAQNSQPTSSVPGGIPSFLAPAEASASTPATSAGATPASLDFDPSAYLSNAILLTGPSGSGKTATVYACAEELGYEVFELFAGMGKRSNKELQSAVGDLGRNHMVSSGGSAGGSNALSALMTSSKSSSSTQPSTHHRQSLILIEEVDIISRDDLPFWSGIIQLINASKRPVVMTCNDEAFVPLDDLALQEVLRFRGVERGLAEECLRLIVYASTKGHVDLGLQELGTLAGQEDEDVVDLRQSIHQLQFSCSGGQTILGEEEVHTPATQEQDSDQAPASDLEDLQLAHKHLSSLSFVFSDLLRPHIRQAGIDDPPQREASGDDLVLPGSWRPLYAQANDQEARVVSPDNGREDEIGDECIKIVRGLTDDQSDLLAPVHQTWESQFRTDLATQTGYLCTMLSTQLRPFTDQYNSLLSFTINPRNHTSISQDYAPILRHIINIEDFEEASYILELHQHRQSLLNSLKGHPEEMLSSTRSTRNSSRFLLNPFNPSRGGNDRFERVFDLGDQVLQMVRKSGSAFVSARNEFHQRKEDISAGETGKGLMGEKDQIIQNVLCGLHQQSKNGNVPAGQVGDCVQVPEAARMEMASRLGCGQT
ncbi:unnamed protein product [Sympodiomycopsis kandeliae]